ncbi:SDR family NAD(P)-dependent oxidoreductase [Pontitalea aquivivens]|uniref:SDR family NAD(P)-dependent oxidoreductase n=1 Tax=Pontitalea aquivivens TaxID=3388663 RepID=UPI003970FB63
MDIEFAGKVVVIVGGGRGIGRATADLFAAAGAKLAIVDINGEAAEEAARSFPPAATAIGVQADIASEDDVKSMVKTVTDRLGRIDVFVNCAAVLDDKLFLESTSKDWAPTVNVCLLGTMLCLRHVLPGMVERGYGRVVCIASDSARLGQARLSYYAAAKAGVIALVKSVAQEVGGSGVTLNVVSPGATNTPLRITREAGLRESMGEEKYARRVKSVLKMYPMGRIGEPDDIAAAIVFLSSDHASWTTGQVLSVNGGFAMA